MLAIKFEGRRNPKTYAVLTVCFALLHPVINKICVASFCMFWAKLAIFSYKLKSFKVNWHTHKSNGTLLRSITAPQMLDGHKSGYFATPLTHMRLSKPCKFHWSTRYHTYALHVQQDSRVRTLTPTRRSRVGVSVYTSIKCVFARGNFLSLLLKAT